MEIVESSARQDADVNESIKVKMITYPQYRVIKILLSRVISESSGLESLSHRQIDHEVLGR